MLTFRIDVDYPYPSRIRSFIHTALDIEAGRDYLNNCKIIARMISESKKEVKAYWFFTTETLPDNEMLKLLEGDKHEIALHIVNNPEAELKRLERATGRKISYYTIHGTARILARMMWRRWNRGVPQIPHDFPLTSFHQFHSIGLDRLCFSCQSVGQVHRILEEFVRKDFTVLFHPIWLFQRGKLNHRGPFYRNLRRMLDVDRDLRSLSVRKKIFFAIARDVKEYERDVIPNREFIEKLRERGVDIFTFLERKWCSAAPNSLGTWLRANDNIALLGVDSYENWWKRIGKKTRNMVRKAEKSGIRTEITKTNEELAKGIWRIYNETPIRQNRGFLHFGTSLEKVKDNLASSENCIYLTAHFGNRIVGFAQLVQGDRTVIISQILALKEYRDRAVNNALIAKTVETTAQNRIPWIIYGRMGNHPSLDRFKQNNGFCQFQLNRYYIPITRKGRIATQFKLHRELRDSLPRAIKNLLIPIYSWVDRTKTRFKLRLA